MTSSWFILSTLRSELLVTCQKVSSSNSTLFALLFAFYTITCAILVLLFITLPVLMLYFHYIELPEVILIIYFQYVFSYVIIHCILLFTNFFEFSQFFGFLTSSITYFFIYLLPATVLFSLINFYITLSTCCFYFFAYNERKCI